MSWRRGLEGGTRPIYDGECVGSAVVNLAESYNSPPNLQPISGRGEGKLAGIAEFSADDDKAKAIEGVAVLRLEGLMEMWSRAMATGSRRRTRTRKVG